LLDHTEEFATLTGDTDSYTYYFWVRNETVRRKGMKPPAQSARLLMAVLAALSPGLLLAGLPPVAHASHVPDCWGDHPTNTPTAGNDAIEGTAEADVLAGGAGDDTISGFDGSDRLCGNEGTDRIRGNQGNRDRIDGGPGDDLLGGGELFPGLFGEPTCGLASGDAAESVFASMPALNIILGGPGDDSIQGAGHSDFVFGGDGDDCLMGIDGDDHLEGDSGADFISAGPGHDVAVGGDDFDDIFGGGANESPDGNDLLYAGSTNVTLPQWPQTCEKHGEFGFETGPVETGDASSSPFIGKRNFLAGYDGYDTLVGSNRRDIMQGDLRGDDLYGFGGRDTLTGNRGSDCLSGGPGPDDLDDSGPVPVLGGPFNPDVQPDDIDTLWGGGDVDTLNARDGDSLDTLSGGGGFNSCTYDPGDRVSYFWLELGLSCQPRIFTIP
jgi:Ca2+-binding RTX toxin-like protein